MPPRQSGAGMPTRTNAVNKLTTPVLIACLCAAGSASAQSYSRYPQDDYQQAQYDYARVIRVDPIIESDRYGGRTVSTSQRCYYRDADDDYTYQGDGYDGYDDGYRDDRYRRDDGYRNEGYGSERYGNDNGRTVATVIGGIAGAVLGSKVGDGSGRYVGTAVGSMIGGMAGRSIYDSQQRNRQVQRGTVRVCDPVPVNDRYSGYQDGRVSGYDVTYEYAGRSYHTRTDHHPGDRIRVRVDVRAE